MTSERHQPSIANASPTRSRIRTVTDHLASKPSAPTSSTAISTWSMRAAPASNSGHIPSVGSMHHCRAAASLVAMSSAGSISASSDSSAVTPSMVNAASRIRGAAARNAAGSTTRTRALHPAPTSRGPVHARRGRPVPEATGSGTWNSDSCSFTRPTLSAPKGRTHRTAPLRAQRPSPPTGTVLEHRAPGRAAASLPLIAPTAWAAADQVGRSVEGRRVYRARQWNHDLVADGADHVALPAYPSQLLRYRISASRWQAPMEDINVLPGSISEPTDLNILRRTSDHQTLPHVSPIS